MTNSSSQEKRIKKGIGDLPKVVAFLIDYYERTRCELDLNEPDANIYNISRTRTYVDEDVVQAKCKPMINSSSQETKV